jgi:hypothetical protein
MALVRIDIDRCVQDSQDYGSDDEHMVSRVFFKITVDGQAKADSHCNLKQLVGDSYESGEIEVGGPAGYSGAFDQQRFAREMTAYFRGLIGSSGGVINLAGSHYIRMKNITVRKRHSFQFEAGEAGHTW